MSIEAQAFPLVRASINFGAGTEADKLGDLDMLAAAGADLIDCQEAGDQIQMIRKWLTANPGYGQFVKFGGGGSKVPILYRKAVLRLDEKRSEVITTWAGNQDRDLPLLEPGAGPERVGPKALTHAVLDHLPSGWTIHELDHHLVASHTRPNTPRRGEVADQQAAAFREEALAAEATGDIVGGSGDWNGPPEWVKKRIPEFVIDNHDPTHRDSQIDSVGHLPHPALTVIGAQTLETSGSRKNADHRAVVVTYSIAARVTTTPTPTEGKPVTVTHLPDNFPDLLRARGLKVREVPGWKERLGTASSSSFGPVGSLVHHTAAGDARPNDITDDYEYVLWMTRQGRSDLSPPLVQVSIGRDGTVYVCAAGRANHAGTARASGSVAAGDGNRLYVGDELQNNGRGEKYPKVQYDAAVTVHAVLHAEVLETSAQACRGHKETSTTGKVDPLFSMDAFRADVDALMRKWEKQPSRDQDRKPNRVEQANALLAEALTEVRKADRLLDATPDNRKLVHALADSLNGTIRALADTADKIPAK